MKIKGILSENEKKKYYFSRNLAVPRWDSVSEDLVSSSSETWNKCYLSLNHWCWTVLSSYIYISFTINEKPWTFLFVPRKCLAVTNTRRLGVSPASRPWKAQKCVWKQVWIAEKLRPFVTCRINYYTFFSLDRFRTFRLNPMFLPLRNGFFTIIFFIFLIFGSVVRPPFPSAQTFLNNGDWNRLQTAENEYLGSAIYHLLSIISIRPISQGGPYIIEKNHQCLRERPRRTPSSNSVSSRFFIF